MAKRKKAASRKPAARPASKAAPKASKPTHKLTRLKAKSARPKASAPKASKPTPKLKPKAAKPKASKPASKASKPKATKSKPKAAKTSPKPKASKTVSKVAKPKAIPKAKPRAKTGAMSAAPVRAAKRPATRRANPPIDVAPETRAHEAAPSTPTPAAPAQPLHAAPAHARPTPGRPRISSYQLAVELARLANDDKCTDVTLLDVRGLSPISDFVIICSGTSDRQMRAVADHAEELGASHGHNAFRASKDARALWLLIDFSDVVIHIFEPNTRAHYDIEMMWGDAKRVAWERDSHDAGPGARPRRSVATTTA